MKIMICDKCEITEKTEKGAESTIKDYTFGSAELQLCPECWNKVNDFVIKYLEEDNANW